MEVNQQEHDRIHDYQVPSHRSQWRSLLQQLLGVEIAHTTTFLDIGHQHQKGGHNHIAIMGGDNCSECFGDSLQAANINWSISLCIFIISILCVLIRIGTLFYKTSKAISLAISCILEQIEKTDKKQLSLRFYPYENLLFLVEEMNLSRSEELGDCFCAIFEIEIFSNLPKAFFSCLIKYLINCTTHILQICFKIIRCNCGIYETNVFKDKI
ncbi:hypothetical protein T08_2777 [Trichinella sp. T8]|nr:hypothetical protein T08_2777 [Trichinella sp. T8]